MQITLCHSRRHKYIARELAQVVSERGRGRGEGRL